MTLLTVLPSQRTNNLKGLAATLTLDRRRRQTQNLDSEPGIDGLDPIAQEARLDQVAGAPSDDRNEAQRQRRPRRPADMFEVRRTFVVARRSRIRSKPRRRKSWTMTAGNRSATTGRRSNAAMAAPKDTTVAPSEQKRDRACRPPQQ